ncbi:MAG: Zn-ribbon domain-containing OB-fold protein [Patescibacteria group bacterium]|nr:Zn-ribbon domain-containing OB-fold protein [Patescibacteria group bacterium]
MSVASIWRHIPSRYNLAGTHCRTCGKYYFPSRTICPRCRRDGKMEEYLFKGTGKVVSYTVIHAVPEGHSGQVPYILAIIKLDEGPRLTGQIVNVRLDGVEIGMEVKPVFRKLGEDGNKGIIYYGAKFEPQ